MVLTKNSRGFYIDNRDGISESKSATLSYETQQSLGATSEGYDKIILYKKSPRVIIKTSYKVIGSEQAWEALTVEMGKSQLDYAKTGKGIVIDSANSGSRLIIGDEVLYAGSYSETDYGDPILVSPNEEYGAVESASWNISAGGYFVAAGGGAHDKEAFFTQPVYPSTGQKNYIGVKPNIKVGDIITIAGIVGPITSVSYNNPRRLGETTVYDVSITNTSELANKLQIFDQ